MARRGTMTSLNVGIERQTNSELDALSFLLGKSKNSLIRESIAAWLKLTFESSPAIEAAVRETLRKRRGLA